MRSVLALSLLAWGLSPTPRAHAQFDSGLLPDAGTCAAHAPPEPPQGDLPANWPAFRMRLLGGPLANVPRFVRRSGGVVLPSTITEVPGGVLLEPRDDLVPGTEYQLFHPQCAGTFADVSAYTATEPLPMPTTLGALDVSPLVASYLARGRENLRYFVRVTLRPDEAMLPFGDFYAWSLLEGAAGAEAIVDGPDALYTRQLDVPVGCNAGTSPALAPGLLTFIARGDPTWARGVELTSDRVEREARCEEAVIVHIGDLEPLTPEQIAFYDMPAPPVDAARDDAGGDAGHSSSARTSCRCSAPGAGPRMSAPLALALTLVLARVINGSLRRPLPSVLFEHSRSRSATRALLR